MIADPILVIVDLQKGFCDSTHNPKLADEERAADHVQDAVEHVDAYVDRYRASGRTPIFVRTHHALDGRRSSSDERPENAPPACLPGTEAAAFLDELDVHDDDVVVTKQGYDPFYDTELEARLEDADVSRVHVGGVFTNICVMSAVLGLTSRQYEVTVLSDCLAASSIQTHKDAVDTLETIANDLRPSADIELSAPLVRE